jgi:hypothetical protein
MSRDAVWKMRTLQDSLFAYLGQSDVWDDNYVERGRRFLYRPPDVVIRVVFVLAPRGNVFPVFPRLAVWNDFHVRI